MPTPASQARTVRGGDAPSGGAGEECRESEEEDGRGTEGRQSCDGIFIARSGVSAANLIPLCPLP